MKKIIILTAVFALVFSGAAMAADWNFYGSSRMRLFSQTFDKDSASNPMTTDSDFTTTQFNQQGNSRIGANVAAGDVSGRFEYGTGVNLRLLYGTWNFGGGKMAVGQMYNPTYYGLSNQVYDGDNGLAGFGAPFSRLDAIEFQFGGFKIAAVEPATSAGGGAYTVSRVVLPKIEAAWNGAVGPVKLHVSGGFNNLENVDPATDKSVTATAWVAQIMGKYNAGPLMVGASFYYGQNLGDYGWNVGPQGAAGATLVGTKVYDSNSMAFTLVVGFTINDMMGIEAGYGRNVNSYDDKVSKNDDPAQSYYIQLPLTLADGVFIVPEFGVWDYDENAAKAKEGKDTYLGAKFQINF